MTVYVCASVTAAAVSSLVFYFYVKRINLCGKSVIIASGVMNALFCAVFPLLFSAVSGAKERNEPVNSLLTVFIILIIIYLLYLGLLVSVVVLRSPGVRLNAPMPSPDGIDVISQDALSVSEYAGVPGTGFSNPPESPGDALAAADVPEFGKNSVDTAQNIDKMGIGTDSRQISKQHNEDIDNLNYLVNCAFDSLGSGKLEEAAEYFYSAIDRHPPLSLEVQIAIQLAMIYSEIGHAELSLDILRGYIFNYKEFLSDSDMAALEAGVGNIEISVAGIEGDVNEEN